MFIHRHQIEGRKLTSSFKWKQYVVVVSRHLSPSNFAIDLLRYDRAFIPNPDDVAKVIQIYTDPMRHTIPEIMVAKFTETKKLDTFTWTIGNWQSYQWDVDILNKTGHGVPAPQKLSTSLKFVHYAVASPILEPDGTGRPLCQMAFEFGPPPGPAPDCKSFPFELMEADLAYPNTEADSGKIGEMLSSLGYIRLGGFQPRSIVLKKWGVNKIMDWNFKAWDTSGWDLQPISESDTYKYSS